MVRRRNTRCTRRGPVVLRIGIVCEGPTDTYAIQCFLAESLSDRGVTSEFIPIQPDVDKTRPTDGGWGLVMNWLKHNPPDSRTRAYFGDGLFRGGLSAKQCDVIIIHMDTDVLSDTSFRNWMSHHFRYSVEDSTEPVHRGSEARRILRLVGQFDELNPDDFERHICAPSVESTETWCIAVRAQLYVDPERLRGWYLLPEFMTLLHESESRRIQPFANVDKNPLRRLRYCAANSSGFRALEDQSFQYRVLVSSLNRWYNKYA